MSGKRFLLDTNAIVQLLKGNADLIGLLANANHIAISIISKIEFLSFPNLTKDDAELFRRFEKKIHLVSLSNQSRYIEQITEVRSRLSFKLPDAIIWAASLTQNCILVTADKKLLNNEICSTESFKLI